MSKKWNIFKKKGNKADSHGTTAADEELQFQPGPLHSNEKITKLSAVQSQSNDVGEPEREQRRSFKDKNTKDQQKNDTNNDWGLERMRNLHIKDDDDRGREAADEHGSGDEVNLSASGNKSSLSSVPLASHRTLTKPGLPNPAQRNFPSQLKDVSISDEYSDPYDALRQRRLEKMNTDGYIEPYKAQKIFQDATHDTDHDSSNSGQSEYARDQGSMDNYQDPWDKKNEHPLETDYPLNNVRDDTLPYNAARRSEMMYVEDRRRNPIDSNLGYRQPNTQGASASETNSSGSDSPVPARNRLIRVDRSRVSPRGSPHFDRRLILPKDNSYSDNYSEPWGNGNKQVKFRPVDKRLIKAEPSLEELRRMSPGGVNSIGTASPLSSGRGSPDALNNPDLSHDDVRRSSSPVITNLRNAGLPPGVMNKLKSKSLDIRNQQQAMSAMAGHRHMAPSAHFPKSASDEQLVGHCGGSSGHLAHPQAYSDYEEPWDRAGKSQTMVTQHNKNAVSHIRSRSYELQKHSPQCDYLPERGITPPGGSFYEQPWDRVYPSNHLQSIQRFQQRKLELHPSEAISTRDFDPLLPLERQIWYHAGITRDEAERRLRDKCEGSYLVRKSESSKDSFSLSVKTLNGCIHMLLRCTRVGNWILGEFSAPFLSAPEMVAHYTHNKLKINDSDYVLLSYPVPDNFL